MHVESSKTPKRQYNAIKQSPSSTQGWLHTHTPMDWTSLAKGRKQHREMPHSSRRWSWSPSPPSSPPGHMAIRYMGWRHKTLHHAVFFPKPHNLCLTMRTVSNKLRLGDFLQESWLALFKTVKIIKTQWKNWETVTEQRKERHDNNGVPGAGAPT